MAGGRRSVGLVDGGRAGPLGLLRAQQEAVLEHQNVEVGGGEAAVGVLGGGNDRLAAHVERGDDEHRAALAPVEGGEDPVEGRSLVRVDGLEARRVVELGHRRDLRPDLRDDLRDRRARWHRIHRRPPILSDRGDEGHVRRGAVELEPLGRVLCEHRGREGPEPFAHLHLRVQGALGVGIVGVGEDRAAAQRPRPELHAALQHGQDAAHGALCSEEGAHCAREGG